MELESYKVLDTNAAEVWRYAWNVTGTVLASSGDGGIIKLWKSNYGNWKCVSQLHSNDDSDNDCGGNKVAV